MDYVNVSEFGNNTDVQFNPWLGQFGVQQKIEVVYLGLIAVLGTLGNLLVIFSIIFSNRSQKNGNQFIINLAVADLLVTGMSIPLIITNLVATKNVLSPVSCRFVGYVVSMSCTASIWNLAGIAVNRYWAVARYGSYNTVFSKTNVLLMISLMWLYCFLVYIPTFYHPHPFDADSMQCGWDPTASAVYNIILLIGGLNIPFAIISLSYWGIYRAIQRSEAAVRGHLDQTCVPKTQNSIRHAKKRRIDLLRTLAVTVIAFLVCWLPYGVIHGMSLDVSPIIGKYFAWLGTTNSTLNFIIYGIMNPLFRRDYINLLLYLAHFGRRRYGANLQYRRTTSRLPT